MYESRHLQRIFLDPAASMAAQLFDAAVDHFIAAGFSTISSHKLAHSAVRFDLDPERTLDVQYDHDRAVLDRCWSVHERAPAPQENPSMRIGSAFPSEYLKASDLQGRTVKVTMSHVEMREVGDGPKPVLHFIGKERGLVLNKTNSNTISASYGDETEDWQGKPIELVEAMVDFQGKSVPAIRVRLPRPGATAAAPARSMPRMPEPPPISDDEVPF